MAEPAGSAPSARRPARHASPARAPRTARVPAGAAAIACLALAFTIRFPPGPVLVWNASASSPVGLYWVARGGDLRAGDRVVALPPPGALRMAAKRGYLPAGVPLVKHVAAAAGARVCATGRLVTVDGAPAATRRPRDPSGRLMPWWTGCRRLGRGELLLLSPGRPDAFDGRYFGVTLPGEIVGKARLLWAA